MERCKRGSAQPRVEEHAQRALEPWGAGSEKVLALQGRSRSLFRPCRALRDPHTNPGFRPLRGSAFGGLHPGLYCSALAALFISQKLIWTSLVPNCCFRAVDGLDIMLATTTWDCEDRQEIPGRYNMKSKITEAINPAIQPIALIWTDSEPDGAARFKPQNWGCVVSLFAAAATKGITGVFDRSSCGCWGGGVGLGFGNQYENFPGGVECFCRFLSSGGGDPEASRPIMEQMSSMGYRRMAEEYPKGERYIKSPEATLRFIESLPIREIPSRFVVVKPLDQTDPDQDAIKNVTFFVDADGLSALTILASYSRPDAENVIIPWAAACQVMGIFAYRELEREHPRALVGMIDIMARKHVRATLGEHSLSFTAPWPLFQEMEDNVAGSFLHRATWLSLRMSKD
jgi:hypothetical protein